MERIKMFKQREKQIIYFNLNGIKSNAGLIGVMDNAKETMKNFKYDSVYTITDITQIPFDTRTKEIAAEWMKFNSSYVANAAFIGATGVRKIMMNMVFSMSRRKNVKLCDNMEQALEWIDSL